MQLLLLFACVVLLMLSIGRWRVHPFPALLAFGLLFALGSGLGGVESVDLLLEGFARTLKWIGVIMVLGAMIGEIANETGGAEQIARSTLRLSGEQRLPPAMALTGYIISIPVFVDVAYIMMQTVTEALAARSKQNILVVGLSLTAGLTASHALMPPTPGPLAVAGILEGQLGRIILVNFFVAFCAMAAGLAWAMYGCRKYTLEYDRKIRDRYGSSGDDESAAEKRRSPWLALLPIFVPLVLIAISSFTGTEQEGQWIAFLKFLGTPLVALSIGVLLALFQYGNDFSMGKVAKVVERSIEKSALVIMITGAGGAFGHVIKNSGVMETISAQATDAGGWGLLFPFILASVFTTTTGSLTVSMITTAAIVAPLLPALGMSPEMAAALIGSGAFCVFHLNSSFFWLLNRLHQVPPATLLKTYTMQSLFMGLGGLAAVMFLRVCGLR